MSIILFKSILSEDDLAIKREQNNPTNLPVGDFTGRCSCCHGDDLWDDETAYGCNDCGTTFGTSGVMPRLVPNG